MTEEFKANPRWQTNNSANSSSSQQLPSQTQQQQHDFDLQLRRRLEETGETDRLQRRLHAQLSECGWHDVLKDRAKEFIRRNGLTNTTVDGLVSELLPVGRATVPTEVKGEVLRRLRVVAKNGDDGSGAEGCAAKHCAISS